MIASTRDDASTSPSAEALSVAARIADHLCETRYAHGGQCTWMGTTQQQDRGRALRLSHETVGPNVYGGTSGIALFLAEASLRTGADHHRATAIAAVGYALSHLDSIPPQVRFGFYTGRIGVAHAAIRVGQLLDRRDLVENGARALQPLERDSGRHALLDVISGAAGAAPTLLQLARRTSDERPLRLALRLSRALVRSARKSRDGWSWGLRATGFETPRNLTGFAHGAAGFGWSLLELYSRFRHPTLLRSALRAFRYENRWFRRKEDNWPDFRETAAVAEAPCRTAWCHGAPGIGFTRLRALAIDGARRHALDVAAAVRSSLRALESGSARPRADVSLCHGLAGIAEFLLSAADVLGVERARTAALDAASSWASQWSGTPPSWPCGVARGTSPSLMLGLAGIGHFYLRIADPTVPSILLPAVIQPE